MRGCFRVGPLRPDLRLVFPAHAGVFPQSRDNEVGQYGLPRACGGVSLNAAAAPLGRSSSPRMRGCFRRLRRRVPRDQVFPAHAGVFLRKASRGLLRQTSSPRMRGCFPMTKPASLRKRVFPAHAGVFLFPPNCLATLETESLPRACGGVSIAKAPKAAKPVSSPRMRGCFDYGERVLSRIPVFPAHAGVFPKLIARIVGYACLPRACGGVSGDVLNAAPRFLSSPRMRGCFRFRIRMALIGLGLPRACGGVSTHANDRTTNAGVFPAHAGVFLKSATSGR